MYIKSSKIRFGARVLLSEPPALLYFELKQQLFFNNNGSNFLLHNKFSLLFIIL